MDEIQRATLAFLNKVASTEDRSADEQEIRAHLGGLGYSLLKSEVTELLLGMRSARLAWFGRGLKGRMWSPHYNVREGRKW